MKLNIRQGVFETNSSSTHNISINILNKFPPLPKILRFVPGYFGTESGMYNSASEKASYLYTNIVDCNSCKELFPKIKKILESYGIKAVFEPTVVKEFLDVDECGKLETYITTDYYYEGRYGAVDGYYQNYDFICEICNDEIKLMSFLFNKESIIQTANELEKITKIKGDYNYGH